MISKVNVEDLQSHYDQLSHVSTIFRVTNYLRILETLEKVKNGKVSGKCSEFPKKYLEKPGKTSKKSLRENGVFGT